MLKSKDYSNYRFVKKYDGQDSCSRDISILKKNNSTWFFKQFQEKGSPEKLKEISITSEVLLQELLRLLIPRHPKTRAILSKNSDDPSGILSKAIEFKSFATINFAKVIYNLLSGNITGMGEIAGWLLYSCELDAKFAGNVGIDEQNRVIKLDGGEAMLRTLNDQLNMHYPINQQDIHNLPLTPPRWLNCNWLDQPKNYSNNYSKLWYLMSFNKKFQIELHGFLFRLILLPDSFINILIDANSPDDSDYKTQLANQFKQRKQLLKNEVMQFPPFLVFLNTPNINNEFKSYLETLQEFKLPGKTKLADLSGDYE